MRLLKNVRLITRVYGSYGKYCHWPKLCINDDASVYILVFNLILSNIHVRQPFPASLAGKKSWKKNRP